MLEESRIPRDEMMEEIKAIRAELHHETEGMTIDEVCRWYSEGATEFLAENGYELVPSDKHPKSYKVVRKNTDK